MSIGQTTSQTGKVLMSTKKLSYLEGPTDRTLLNVTLGGLLQKQAAIDPQHQCLVFPECEQRFTYGQLLSRSLDVAKGLLAYGVKRGDRIGILAGNSPSYVELLFASSHVGAISVVLNIAYTAAEIRAAATYSGCNFLFISHTIGKNLNHTLVDMLEKEKPWKDMPELQQVILLKDSTKPTTFPNYETLIQAGRKVLDAELKSAMNDSSSDDVCNLQFTSGTTGSPKAAMLTHNNIVNNGHFVGDRMRLQPDDVLCCPPPLFHCFGLVLGLLAVITHRSTIVFPSETFEAKATMDAVVKENCTALHGVPAMFSAQFELLEPHMKFPRLRTGIAAGTSVPRKIMEDLRGRLNCSGITITYGMTETSPASFMTFTDDPVEKRLATVGKILPHMKAKILNPKGEIVPVGTRGELFVAGYALQKGYFRNEEKTAEVMSIDDQGTLWMQTGDEVAFDEEGYCRVTGRIKDIIIRGGENIFPLEIEERLIQHPAIVQASVVGLADKKYGEVVCAFLQQRAGQSRPSLKQLQDFVIEQLARHKMPSHAFWLADDEDFPKTGSGKIQKFALRKNGNDRLSLEGAGRSKL